MKKYLIHILFIILIISCNENKSFVVEDDDKFDFREKRDSIAIQVNKEHYVVPTSKIKDTIKINDGEGPLFSLPIKSFKSYDEMISFLGENKWYRLPQINKINYIDVRNENDTICCLDRKNKEIYKSVKEIFDFKAYRFRLPDVSIYEVYMINGNYTERLKVYKENHISASCCAIKIYNLEFNYLILYNERNQDAILLDIANSSGSPDGSSNRFFSINENYEITLKETYYYFSDVDEYGNDIIENETKQISTIRILQSGDIEIKYPRRIDFTNEGKEIIINPRTIIYSSDGKIKSITIQK